MHNNYIILNTYSIIATYEQLAMKNIMTLSCFLLLFDITRDTKPPTDGEYVEKRIRTLFKGI